MQLCPDGFGSVLTYSYKLAPSVIGSPHQMAKAVEMTDRTQTLTRIGVPGIRHDILTDEVILLKWVLGKNAANKRASVTKPLMALHACTEKEHHP